MNLCRLGFLPFGILTLPVWLLAQGQCTASGQIIDHDTKQPIPNVNVIVRDTQLGTSSDSAGMFRMYLPARERFILEFSHIAYRKTSRAVFCHPRGGLESRVQLLPITIPLNEVIVSGKSRVALAKAAEDRALFRLTGDEFEKVGESDMERAMRYLLPDVVKPLIQRLNSSDDDFTLYIDREWKESIYLDEIDPSNVRRVLVWHAPGRMDPIDIFPVNLPLRRGKRYVVLIETK